MGAEFAFIAAIRQAVAGGGSPALGIGDDCAVWTPTPGCQQLVSTDLLIEDIHFTLGGASGLTDLGQKALAVNLSDVAAMGGVPCYVTLGLGLPGPPESYRALMDGFIAHAAACGVSLIGGDTCAARDRLMISVTVIGEAPTGRAVTRSGAKPGDRIYLTGCTGESAAGLALLSNPSLADVLDPVHWDTLLGRHLRPTARLAEGALLGESGLASAMIDVSDGVAPDLGHILTESRVGAELDADKIPVSDPLNAFADATGGDALNMALGGGEDYELLFTVRPGHCAEVEGKIAAGELNARAIGHIHEQTGLTLVRGGQSLPVPGGFEHFS
jgi:thiamine-monophosphate kinase